ncbi:MAG: hypothetical protein P4L51_16125 [Puia sp.]|nr:hypothetical protein [Puia sp.]
MRRIEYYVKSGKSRVSQVCCLLAALLFFQQTCLAQLKREDIYTDFVLYQKRTLLEKDLRDRVTGAVFSAPLDSNTEYKYELACQAVTQFLLVSPLTARGFDKLFSQYDSLQYDTKRAFLEAVYAAYPEKYRASMQTVLARETDPKLFAICALYLYRTDTTMENVNFLKIRMVERFPGYDSLVVLDELTKYLGDHTASTRRKTPDIPKLFGYRQNSGQKTVYSFQRWDRDYPGLAIVQNADGSFAKDAEGRLQVFEQLARSGSDLPCFISNGSTPQGIFRITGIGVSRNHFIGPTPNLQLIMPFEESWDHYFRPASVPPNSMPPAGHPGEDDSDFHFSGDTLLAYQSLLPPSWRTYTPMMEAWFAGKAGRTGIIAHGTTLDPEFFRDRPFYPLTPTEGCLCAEERWNPTTGHLLVSEQLNLVNAFNSTPGDTGYLFVIDVDDQRKPVSRAEVEGWVKKYEQR